MFSSNNRLSFQTFCKVIGCEKKRRIVQKIKLWRYMKNCWLESEDIKRRYQKMHLWPFKMVNKMKKKGNGKSYDCARLLSNCNELSMTFLHKSIRIWNCCQEICVFIICFHELKKQNMFLIWKTWNFIAFVQWYTIK